MNRRERRAQERDRRIRELEVDLGLRERDPIDTRPGAIIEYRGGEWPVPVSPSTHPYLYFVRSDS